MAISRLRRNVPLILFGVAAFCIVGSYILIPRGQQRRNTELYLNFEKVFFKGPASNFTRGSERVRKNLIIVSHGRSGSSLMGDIFNHHPSVFYMYEPLQSPERVMKRFRGGNINYSQMVDHFLSGLFRCTFDDPDILYDMQRYYRKPDHPRISQAIASPPLCPYRLTDPKWNPNLCHPMTSKALGTACRDHYDLTVIKVLMARIPENSIKTIFSSCDSKDVDCKVVFLIRDPRAVITSSRIIGFFKETGERTAFQGTRIYSYKRCKQTEENLEYVRRLPDSLRERIKVQRFEDLAMNPLKELSSLYEFAGLPVLESVKTWLKQTTHSSRAACNHMDGVDVTCTKDDYWTAINRWRWGADPREIDIIEHYCAKVMNLMGYRPVDRSNDLLVNRTIPLFRETFEAKHWFLH